MTHKHIHFTLHAPHTMSYMFESHRHIPTKRKNRRYAKAAEFFEMDEYGKSNLSACKIKASGWRGLAASAIAHQRLLENCVS